MNAGITGEKLFSPPDRIGIAAGERLRSPRLPFATLLPGPGRCSGLKEGATGVGLRASPAVVCWLPRGTGGRAEARVAVPALQMRKPGP